MTTLTLRAVKGSPLTNTEMDNNLSGLNTSKLEASNNLSDIVSAVSALTNLGLTATAVELNTLDGITATTAQLNFVTGVTSAIQTQFTGKASTATTISAGTGLTGGGSLAANRTISGVSQLVAAWEAGVSTTEGVVSPDRVAAAITAQAVKKNATNLFIDSAVVTLRDATGAEKLAEFIGNDGAYFYFNNVGRLWTTGTGATVFGTLATDAISVNGGGVVLSTVKGQTTTGGVNPTSLNGGTKSSGTFTMAMGDGPLQHITNGGAFALAPGTGAGAVILDITNSATAGVITTAGFTFVDGDAFTTTSGHKFRCSVIVGNAGSTLTVKAMQ